MSINLTYKLISGFIILALMMCGTSYLTIRSFNELKMKIVQLETDSIEEFITSDKIVYALEASEEAVKALVDNQPNIIYQFSNGKNEFENKDPFKKSLIQDLSQIVNQLSALIGTEFIEVQNEGASKSKNFKRNEPPFKYIEKKYYNYYLRYLTHFIHLVEKKPESAPVFFKKTLEPYYEQNIYPMILTYRKNKRKETAERLNQIIVEYLPNVGIIIVLTTLAILMSILLFGIWVSRHVFKPLSDLAIAANKVGKGNFDSLIKIKTKDEIGILTNIFNKMIKDLRKSTVSKNYMDNVVDSMLDTLIVANPDFTIRRVNQSAIDMLEYSQKELMGQSIENIIFTEKESTSIIDIFKNKKSIVNVEMIYRTKKGVEIPVLFSGATFFNSELQIEGIVCVAQDISDLKQSQANLEKAYDAMEHKVEKRTEELSTANISLKEEIKERMLTEKALKDSEKRLRRLSSGILTSQEKIRKQISSELHDDMGQSLSLLKVKLSIIQKNSEYKSGQNDEIFTELQEYIDYILENVRRISRYLSPSILEDLGLTAALKWMFKEFSNHYKIKTHLNIHKIDSYFTLDSQIIIYRIFQEFLNNVAKHAKADKISIYIQKKKDTIDFSMEDNGIGFNLSELSLKESTQKGIGLAAMEERALMLKSLLKIDTRKEEGTKISFVIRRKNDENLSNVISR